MYFFRKLIVKVLKNNGMFDVCKILVCDNGNKNGNLPFCCYGFQTGFDLRSFQLPSFLFLLSFFFFFCPFFPQNLYIYFCLSFHFHLITFVLALNANVSKTSVSLSDIFFPCNDVPRDNLKNILPKRFQKCRLVRISHRSESAGTRGIRVGQQF